MRPLLIPLAALGFACSVHAQTSTASDPKASAWLMNVQRLHVSKPLPRHELAFPKPDPLPAALMDTLSRYDWVEVGHLWLEDVTFSEEYGKPKNLYPVTRFAPDGTMTEYMAGLDSTTGRISIRPKDNSAPWQMTRADTLDATWLCYEPDDCMRILRCSDGYLILDVDDGLSSFAEIDYPRKYRVAYLGVDKGF